MVASLVDLGFFSVSFQFVLLWNIWCSGTNNWLFVAHVLFQTGCPSYSIYAWEQGNQESRPCPLSQTDGCSSLTLIPAKKTRILMILKVVFQTYVLHFNIQFQVIIRILLQVIYRQKSSLCTSNLVIELIICSLRSCRQDLAKKQQQQTNKQKTVYKQRLLAVYPLRREHTSPQSLLL